MVNYKNEKVKLFSLNANKPLAEEIAALSSIPLSNVEVSRFADGEININIDESVRGCEVIVIQPTSSPVNEHIMELLVFCDACKRASAESVTVVMPYYGYSRQDRKAKSRQPITAKLVADLLQVSGVNRVVCLDLHAAQIQGFFNIPIDNLLAGPILSEYFLSKAIKNMVVVSPDHGGVTRARKFAERLGAELAIIDKVRPEPNKAEVMNIIGKVKGMSAIIIDDIIDTAGTMCAAAEALLNAGAIQVFAAATHGIFSGTAFNNINSSRIKEIVVTNSVLVDSINKTNKLTIISIAPLLAETISRIVNGQPISALFETIENSKTSN